MIIKIDNRETELIKACQLLQVNNPTLYKDIEIKIENLPIGDIILEKNGNEIIILERKSIQDLASSIKDGRYEEQSYRLNGNPLHNHNIIYLLEGDINRWKHIMPMIYSAMVSLQYFKGFSVMRSFNMAESAFLICQMAHKINKEESRTAFYSNTSGANREKHEETSENININKELEETNYCSVIKKVKKENITPENIGEIMLSQIPGISSVTAIAIMKQYTSLPNLLEKMKEDPTCIQNITYANAKGQQRKINKNVSENIIKYFPYSQ